MGIGGELVGDLEQLMTTRALQRRALFRMTGATSQCWRAEAEIESMYPGMRCLLLPSATLGLSLLLEVLGVKPGQEVLTSPLGWLSNWSCLDRAGLTPRFLPLDDELQLRASDVDQRIGPRTGAVIVTHLMGRGQQAVHDIAQTCRERGVLLLEDVAQSFGVSIRGRRAGTFGAGAWCSTNHHKILSTGDGGFALIRGEEAFERLSARHDQGNALNNGGRRRPAVLEPGLSLRVNELTASVLRAQMARFHVIRARILALHGRLATACREELKLQLLESRAGDLPFTVMFRRPPGMRHPTLADSGWHVAGNVPWLSAKIEQASREDPAVAETLAVIASTSCVGAGFEDKYYGIPYGLTIGSLEEDVPHLVAALRETL